MIQNIRNLSFGFLLIVLLISLTACGNNASESSGDGNGDEKVTLTLWNNWTDDTTQALQERLQKFKESHPNIEIKEQRISNADYRTKLKTQAAGNQLPELFMVFPGAELTPFVEGGVVQPIDNVAAELEGLINESALKDFAVDGKQYAIPSTVAYTSLVFYDEDMLSQVGYDSFPKTYSEFKDLIKKLNEEGITPIQLGNKAQWPLQSSYMSMIGDRMTGSDFLADVFAGEAKFTDSKFVEALSIIKELDDIGAFNKDANTISDAQARGNFLQGESAMYISGSWATTTLLEEMPSDKNINVAIFPSIEGGEGNPNKVSGVGGFGIAMNSDLSGKQKEAAEEFLKYFYDKELYENLLEDSQLVPVDVELPEDASPLFKDVYKATQGGTAPVYDATLTAELTQTINNGLQGLLTGSTTPEELAEQMQSQLDQ